MITLVPEKNIVTKGGVVTTSISGTQTQRWIYLVGGTAGIVGSLLGMVGNLVHPVTPIGDPEGVARVIADSDIWLSVHLAIVIGILLMLGGLVALHESVPAGLAGALSRLGLFTAVVGIGIGLVLVILDGVAAHQLAEEWAAAPAAAKPVALQLTLANETVNLALASLFNLVFAAATYTLFGLAVVFSGTYPRWFGWIAVAAGISSFTAGLIQAYAGEPTSIARVLTIVGPTVITLWTAAVGIVLVRRAAHLR